MKKFIMLMILLNGFSLKGFSQNIEKIPLRETNRLLLEFLECKDLYKENTKLIKVQDSLIILKNKDFEIAKYIKINDLYLLDIYKYLAKLQLSEIEKDKLSKKIKVKNKIIAISTTTIILGVFLIVI